MTEMPPAVGYLGWGRLTTVAPFLLVLGIMLVLIPGAVRDWNDLMQSARGGTTPPDDMRFPLVWHRSFGVLLIISACVIWYRRYLL